MERLIAIEDITRLMRDCVAAIDEGRLADMASMFEDAEWEVTGRSRCRGQTEVLADLRNHTEQQGAGSTTRHVITNIRIDLSGNAQSATATSYVTIVQTIAGSSPHLVSVGSFHDGFVHEQGRWRFTERVLRYEPITY